MNTTTEPDLFNPQPQTIEATGSELLDVCRRARSGELTILSLSVTANGRYTVRVMATQANARTVEEPA